MTTSSSRRALAIECLLVFGALPAVLSFFRPGGGLIIIIWTLSYVSWIVLMRGGITLRQEWKAAALNAATLKPIVRRFLPFALAMLLFAWLTVPERFFELPLDRPRVWVMVMLLYPLLSVIPQEILFRSYFLNRYKPLLPTPRLEIANALAFGWAHVILHNWVAVVFSVIGGWMFAETYRKTGSLAAAWFEHTLYGCFIFTIGLGVFFYHGAAR